ncbi:MAG TPA: DMT family transporter [Candidatus Udaeobacter sp.]|nr:DMT family transporter [Candidatus Udaeobacter sp.]
MSRPRNSLLPYAALIGLALIWGASFLFIKVAVRDMSPEVMLLLRSGSGFVTLAVLVWAMGRPLFGEGWRTRVFSYAFMAVTNAVIPWIAIGWGEERISSGLASILNATTTLWTAVLIYWVVPNERPTVINYTGVLIGFAGVVLLVYPDVAAHGLSGSFFGAMAVVLAAFSYAINALYQRRKMRSVSVFEVSLGQLAVGTIFAVPIAAPTLPQVHVQLVSIAAVLALGAGGTGIAYLLYYYVMNTLGAVRAAGVTLLVPITAVFWGVALLGEKLTLGILVGMGVILAGVVLTNLRRMPGRKPVAEADSAAA